MVVNKTEKLYMNLEFHTLGRNTNHKKRLLTISKVNNLALMYITTFISYSKLHRKIQTKKAQLYQIAEY